MAKKITAVLLAVLFCFAAVGCSNDGTPDGMHLVSLEGEPFKLYVPDSWTSNSASGISSAFFSATDNIAVSARYYTPASEETTLDSFVEACVLSYAESMRLFELVSNEPAVLGAADAKRLIYKAELAGVDYKFCQYTAKYDGVFVTLTFHAPTEQYDDYTEHFTSITDAFVLCERTEVSDEAVTDKHTPEGMKIASSDVVEYRLYVPTAWVCTPEEGGSHAYYPESGKPNVSVSSYSPDESMTAEEYFDACEEQYKQSISGYELLSTSDRKMSNRDAKIYTYRAVYGGASMRIMQVIFVQNDLVYSFTYTALEDSFDAHMEDVEAMLDAFSFR